MRFKARKVTRPTGEVELRLCLTLSAEEAENAPRIADDPSVTLDVHRMARGESLGVYADQVLCWLRILVFWVGVWGDKENQSRFITHSILSKKAKQRPPRKRRERKKRRKPS